MEVKRYPKKTQRFIEKSKNKLLDCPICRRNHWTEFIYGYLCQTPEYELITKKQQPQNDKKVLTQEFYLSTRLRYASTKIRETYYSMANVTYNKTQEMVNKLQNLRGKTKLKIHQNISSYYDGIIFRRQSGYFQFEEDVFGKKAGGIAKNMHEH